MPLIIVLSLSKIRLHQPKRLGITCESVAAGANWRRGHAPRAELSRGGISKKSTVIIYKLYTYRYPSIRGVPWRLKCTEFIFRRAPPHTHAGVLPTFRASQLGPRARRGGRAIVCPGRHRPKIAPSLRCVLTWTIVPRRTSHSRSSNYSLYKYFTKTQMST